MSPSQVLRRFYEAELAYLTAGGPGRASFAGIASLLDPQVVMHQAAGLPYGGDWVGPDGVERFFAAMNDTWEYLEVREPRFLEDGDTLVVLCDLVTRSRARGVDMHAPMVQVIQVRDGLIVDFRPFYWDTAAVAAACAHHDET
ncbi:nuclear transport factor 2 family protein [Jannaschia sp. R86511]|uniref:nuclear transport factor 2 family protein n=1 Tax=Jannaschia sp. R86511 TaxID=3093853 RepID=UPI0036D2B5B1